MAGGGAAGVWGRFPCSLQPIHPGAPLMFGILRGARVIAHREILRFLQEPSRMVGSFAMPLLFLVIFGVGLEKLVGSLAPGVGYLSFMYPGILGMTVVMTSLFSGLSVVWDREFGFLKEVLASPLPRSGVVLGKATGGALVALLQVLMLLIPSRALGVHLTFARLVELVPIIVIVSLAVSGLGILVAARMRSQQGFQVVMQVLVFPLMFLSGVFFPPTRVPAWLRVVVRLNPVTYGVDAIRQVVLGLHPTAGGATGVVLFGHVLGAWTEIGLVAALGTVLIALAAWSFSKVG